MFEDTLAGPASARAAGINSVVVTVTHGPPLQTDVHGVLDYAQLQAVWTAEGLLLVILISAGQD